MNRQLTKQERRRERREEQRHLRMAQLRAERRKRIIIVSSLVAAVVIVILVGVSFYLSRANATTARPQAASSPVSTSTSATLSPLALGNIDCNSSEQLTYHVHAHLSLYINGRPVAIPANVGIDDSNECYYWLHTHDSSGIIHIEAPQKGTYTLGTFLQLWGQRFSQLGYPQQLNQATGWRVYVNGKPYSGDFHNIALEPHMLITMAYQSPGVTPDTVFNWGDL